ncbi:MAG TPA: hypothetical protein VLL75_07295 [Vicinamibacteria bacterium]|nr:hypothetical protein [Vicinamibacteria bacterium]
MRSTLRIAGVVVLACVGWTAPAPAQDPPAPGAAPARDPAPPEGKRRAARRRPIQDSIDRIVESVVVSHMKPCEVAQQQGVPCFPVSVEQEGPRFSVAEALRRYRATGRPAPGVPTVAEIQDQMSGAPQSASGGVGFDPVCTAKNLVKKLSGRATTFYLYRMWDERGERPLLTDREIDPKAYAANPAVRYEYLGEFDGECAAVAAWRQALRKATEPKPLPDDWDDAQRDGPPD